MTALPSPGWSIRDWHAAYDAGTLTPECIVALKRQLPADDPAWISVASDDHIEAQLRLLAQRLKDVHGKREALPLYGIPFAVKDNIDAAGFTTTAACAAFAYQPETDAHVVAKLRQAGAIVLGKTNLDQFATGLVGTRSPYGVVPNAFDARYISGGSSSGSGSVVARGLVPFALGTDTAGSGRVPAALNNIVGLKPTRGALSTRGVVPACRTLDCVSLFTLTVEDAALVRSIVSDFDSEDPYARPTPRDAGSPTPNRHFAIPNELEFNSDALAQKAYEQTLERFSALGWRLTPIDFTPFRDLARMLYEGPWVAERFSVMEATLQRDAPGLDPTVKSIVQAGSAPSAVQAFRAEYRRAQLARTINRLLEPFDALIVPTVPTAFTLDAVQAEPIRTNSLLGTYTNFTNLADLCGLAVPGLFREDGLPAGVTLLAPAWNDSKILHLGANIEALLALPRGATGVAHVPSRNTPSSATATFSVAVVGAHLSGLALNPQLTALGGTLQRETTTAAHYKLYVLPNSTPLKPGMVRAVGGAPLTVEVWTLPPEGFARFVAAVPEPLCIGNVELCDGSAVKGFLCEPYAIQGAEEITNYGGFRQYLAALA